jgi:hypothetical protein
MTANAENTTRIRIPEMRHQRVTKSGIEDEWSSAADFYVIKYAAPVAFPRNPLEAAHIVSVWLQAGGKMRDIDDLASLTLGRSEESVLGPHASRDFLLSYLHRTHVNNVANRPLFGMSYISVGGFDARANLIELLSRPLNSPAAPETLEVAEAALARLRARNDELVQDWADQLSADLAVHTD